VDLEKAQNFSILVMSWDASRDGAKDAHSV